eukprot:6414217-Amphidinium_carterae.1
MLRGGQTTRQNLSTSLRSTYVRPSKAESYRGTRPQEEHKTMFLHKHMTSNKNGEQTSQLSDASYHAQ